MEYKNVILKDGREGAVICHPDKDMDGKGIVCIVNNPPRNWREGAWVIEITGRAKSGKAVFGRVTGRGVTRQEIDAKNYASETRRNALLNEQSVNFVDGKIVNKIVSGNDLIEVVEAVTQFHFLNDSKPDNLTRDQWVAIAASMFPANSESGRTVERIAANAPRGEWSPKWY